PAIPACPVRPKSGHSANDRAYEYTDRQAGKSNNNAPVVIQRLDDRGTFAPLYRHGLEHMSAQKVAGDAYNEPEQEGNAATPGLQRPRRHAGRYSRTNR